MGRMHSKGKGMSKSSIPYKRSAPLWCKTTPEEIKDMIAKMAKKGMTPSQIGIILRDNHGIPQVSTVTNSKIRRRLCRKICTV
jgi:small subunit ribosomal protein S13e